MIAEAQRLGLDGVSLETSFSVRQTSRGPARLPTRPPHLSWCSPGCAERPRVWRELRGLSDLLRWVELAAAARTTVLRIVVGGPALRGRQPVGRQIERTCAPLRVAAARAAALGIRLAVENHADLTAHQLETLIERAATESLGVCFDSANALRVGDEPVEALRRLAPHVLMVHLKDVEHTAEEPMAVPAPSPTAPAPFPLRDCLTCWQRVGSPVWCALNSASSRPATTSTRSSRTRSGGCTSAGPRSSGP